MYELLANLDLSIKARYDTLEKNLKNKSNSFYDSYLDLIECFSKYVADDFKIKIPNNITCGRLLCNSEFRNVYFSNLKCSDNVFSHMQDIIIQCNDHKHTLEKELSFDDVCEYLQCFFDYANYYIHYKTNEICIFDKNYFSSIFGSIENDKKNYEEREEKISQQLNSMSEILNEIRRKEPTPKNVPVQSEKDIMKKFFAYAIIRIIYCNQGGKLKDRQIHFLIITCIYGLIAFLTTILCSVNLGLYCTFTLFENIYLIMQLVKAIKTLCLGESSSQEDYISANKTKFIRADNGAYFDSNKMKLSFRIFGILNYVSIIANIICNWCMNASTLAFFVTLFELVLFVMNILLTFKNYDLLIDYCLYEFKGKNTKGETIEIYFNKMSRKYMTKEEYNKIQGYKI